jgi:hypothetical protein
VLYTCLLTLDHGHARHTAHITCNPPNRTVRFCRNGSSTNNASAQQGPHQEFKIDEPLVLSSVAGRTAREHSTVIETKEKRAFICYIEINTSTTNNLFNTGFAEGPHIMDPNVLSLFPEIGDTSFGCLLQQFEGTKKQNFVSTDEAKPHRINDRSSHQGATFR